MAKLPHNADTNIKPRERQEITIAGGRDGVKAVGIGLVPLRVDAGGDDAVRLALPVRELTY